MRSSIASRTSRPDARRPVSKPATLPLLSRRCLVEYLGATKELANGEGLQLPASVPRRGSGATADPRRRPSGSSTPDHTEPIHLVNQRLAAKGHHPSRPRCRGVSRGAG